jgi:hypothetical protein
MSAEAKRSPENREALWRNVGLAAAFVVPFAVYLFTLAPSLTFEDPMELTLRCGVLAFFLSEATYPRGRKVPLRRAAFLFYIRSP